MLFSADGSKLIAYPSGRNGTSYTVPDGTSSIGTYAFADAGWLQVLDLPDSLASFSQDCIALCSSLNTVKYRGTAYTGEDFIRRFAAIKKPGGQRPCNKRAGTYDRPAVF